MSQLKQQVNFFREEFKKPEIKLPAIQMLQIAALFLVGFLVVGIYQTWSLKDIEQRIEKQKSQQAKLEKQYQDLQAIYVEPTEDPGLLAEIKQIDDDMAKKNKLKTFLQREANKSLFSFASVLDSLSSSDVKNIWLTEIKIKTTGNQYELQGLTQHADSIPEYIEQLKKAQALKGTSFSLFNLERDEENENFLHFILSSEQTSESVES